MKTNTHRKRHGDLLTIAGATYLLLRAAQGERLFHIWSRRRAATVYSTSSP